MSACKTCCVALNILSSVKVTPLIFHTQVKHLYLIKSNNIVSRLHYESNLNDFLSHLRYSYGNGPLSVRRHRPIIFSKRYTDSLPVMIKFHA